MNKRSTGKSAIGPSNWRARIRGSPVTEEAELYPKPNTAPLAKKDVVHILNEKIAREIRYRLLKLLSENPRMTQRDLSAEMGISLGKINFCLSELTRKGLIKINRFKGAKKKTNYLYKLTPYGLEEKARVTVSFLRQKQREYEEIKRQIEELEKEAETAPKKRQPLKTMRPSQAKWSMEYGQNIYSYCA